jgi:ribosomal protein S12 methylthiotransferase
LEGGPCRKGAPRLAQLLRELSNIEGLHWIRILYAYPSYFSDDLIEEIATNPKVLPNIHGPGDNTILHTCMQKRNHS